MSLPLPRLSPPPTAATKTPLRWGVHDSRWGRCLLACSEHGLCHLSFVVTSDADAVAALQRRWPQARLQDAPAHTAPLAARLDSAWAPPKLHLQGRPFQLQVWQALLTLGPGKHTTYGGLAQQIGRPRAARAVGQAVGANPIALWVPCHRVLGAGGQLGGYRWGIARKRALLEAENQRTV